MAEELVMLEVVPPQWQIRVGLAGAVLEGKILVLPVRARQALQDKVMPAELLKMEELVTMLVPVEEEPELLERITLAAPGAMVE